MGPDWGVRCIRLPSARLLLPFEVAEASTSVHMSLNLRTTSQLPSSIDTTAACSMEPLDLFSTDRVVFDAELEGLIGAAAGAASSIPTATLTTSPMAVHQFITADPRLRKRAAASNSGLPKRQKVEKSPPCHIKTEVVSPSATFTAQSTPEARSHLPARAGSNGSPGSDDQHDRHVHPSRRVLVDRPDAQHLRDVFCGPGPEWTNAERDEGRLQRSDAVSEFVDAVEADGPGLPDRTGSGRPVLYPHAPAHHPRDDKTWATQRNAVRRQWDPRKDDLEYEALLELRRSEKIDNIDRYVPIPGDPRPQRRPAPPRRNGPFPFGQLPEQVRTRILGSLLVSDQPIRIDFTWLRTFVQGHARIPKASKEVNLEGVCYKVQVQWDKLVDEVKLMQGDMRPFQFALEERAMKTRKARAPCRGLTTSLLKVSRDVHKLAARVLYGSNTFSFPWATSAWMQLESFLATIGPTNTGYLRSITIHGPLWHLGMHEDFVEGAILDLTSPASRMAVIKPPASDRLLSAIQSSVNHLLQSGNLTKLALELSQSFVQDFTSQRESKTLITMSDAEACFSRKRDGIELLKCLSEALPNEPALQLRAPGRPEWGAYTDLSMEILQEVMTEAEKYGCGSIIKPVRGSVLRGDQLR